MGEVRVLLTPNVEASMALDGLARQARTVLPEGVQFFMVAIYPKSNREPRQFELLGDVDATNAIQTMRAALSEMERKYPASAG